MKIEEIKEEAIALGWVDLFENEGILWGYTSDRDVMPQIYPKQPPKMFGTPVLQGIGGISLAGRSSPIARNERISPTPSFNPDGREDLRRRRREDRFFSPWDAEIPYRGRPIYPGRAWVEFELTAREDRGRQALRIEDISYNKRPRNWQHLPAYFLEFRIDRDLAIESNFLNMIVPDRKVVFNSGDGSAQEYMIVSTRIHAIADYFRTELEIA
ncbi:MAG: hypothetical protein ACRC11_19800 [Xenococcaceae cyanobacterium]